MQHKLNIDFTEEEYEQLKKNYQKEKQNYPNLTFDEYLEKWVNFAVKTQFQFVSFNDKLTNFSSNLFDNFNFDNFKFKDYNMDDLSNFVNNLFNAKTEQKKESKNQDNSNETNKKMN